MRVCQGGSFYLPLLLPSSGSVCEIQIYRYTNVIKRSHWYGRALQKIFLKKYGKKVCAQHFLNLFLFRYYFNYICACVCLFVPSRFFQWSFPLKGVAYWQVYYVPSVCAVDISKQYERHTPTMHAQSSYTT